MEITQQVKQFFLDDIVRGVKGCELQDSSNLIEGGILDSLGIMKLLTHLEKTFQIQIEDHELVPENFETLEAISNLVVVKSNSK